FFFSSRRRHTRFSRDWSSDVCSSDLDRRKLKEDAQRCLDRLGVKIDPSTQVLNLSVAQCQMVEIAKALSLNASVLIMDEPTSSRSEERRVGKEGRTPGSASR